MPFLKDLQQAQFLNPTDLMLLSQGGVSKSVSGAQVNPWGGPTPAEQAVGITPVFTGYPENDVRRYGAIGAGEDNTAHINAALLVASRNGRPALGAGLLMNSTGGHQMDRSTTSWDGQGALILCPTADTAWTDFATGSGSATNVEHFRHPMMNTVVRGAGNTVGVGLSITDTAEPAAAFLNYYNVVFEQFGQNLAIGNNAYILKFFGCAFARGGTGLLIPQNITNAAEQVSFSGCAFTDNLNFAVDNQNGNSDLVLENCHLDGNNLTYYRGDHGSRTYMTNCHMEILAAAQQNVDPIQVLGTNCYLNMNGGAFIADGTGMPALSAFNIGAGARVKLGGGILLNNLRNTVNNGSGVLARGAGSIFIEPGGTDTYNATQLPIIIGLESNFNLLADGGFEQASIRDNIAITSDTAAITSRTAGTNISLAVSNIAHNGGAQCLAATKLGAIGTAAGFGIIVPCQPGQRFAAQGYYACDQAVTQSIFLYIGFAILTYGSNGVPIYQNFSLQSGANITQLSTAFTYFNSGGQFIAPPWANCCFLNCNLNGLGPRAFYLDDVVLSAM